MLALAFVAGAYLAVARAKREGLASEKIIDLVFVVLIASLVGARLMFVLLNSGYYLSHPVEIFKIWEGGLVFYGGFIGGFLMSVWFLKRNQLKIWKVADILAPSLALGASIGRIGCFLNGCCYGKISSAWGMRFPAQGEPPVYTRQLLDGLLSYGAQRSLPVLPTQLYEAFAYFVLFLFLLRLDRHKKSEGVLFWNFVFLYSIARFIIEGFRYYETNFIVFGFLTVSQFISMVFALIAFVCLVRITTQSLAGAEKK
jgi:phosphatidylglycerol:prolipoprotein diacylglycerol transferase